MTRRCLGPLLGRQPVVVAVFVAVAVGAKARAAYRLAAKSAESDGWPSRVRPSGSRSGSESDLADGRPVAQWRRLAAANPLRPGAPRGLCVIRPRSPLRSDCLARGAARHSLPGRIQIARNGSARWPKPQHARAKRPA